MNNDLNTMQESIKIALDAADAATDVTSEYKRMKTEYLKAEQKVKEIHKYTTVIFSASIGTAIVAILLTGLLYFKSLSELEDMTNTSREALVVFAENVESVNKAVDNMNQSLEKHSDLVNTNTEIKNKLSELMDAIDQNDKNLMVSLSKEISNLSKSVSSSIKSEAGKLSSNIQEGDVLTSAKISKAIDKLISDNKKNSNIKMLKELSNSTSSLTTALKAISSQNKLLVKEITEQKENITFP
jgi:predicted PurR-regulated permease PerM